MSVTRSSQRATPIQRSSTYCLFNTYPQFRLSSIIHRAAYPPPIHRLSTTNSPPPVFQCNRRCVTKHGRMEIRRVVYAKSLVVFLSLDHYGREQERVSFTRQGRDRRPSKISKWKGGLLPGLKRLQTISDKRIWKDNTNAVEHYPGCSR